MRHFLLLLVAGLCCLMARAIPADPTPVKVNQPDGTTLTIQLHGDEFFHFTTTVDGYTVLKNSGGYYTYARLDGDRLVPGERIARDPDRRSAADLTFLSSLPKRLTSRSAATAGAQKLGRRNSAMRRVGAEGDMDYDGFRGLIILINYTNKKFSMPEANSFYNDMVNTHDYTGYVLNNRRVNMTGSVRDYYYDNSYHQFDPVFDVVGPVDVPFVATYPQSTSRADAVFHAAIVAADSLINYSDYDSDGDGVVDMVFFLVAGYAANYSGNNEGYLWPHMYYLFNEAPRDGVEFGLYASSTEIAGWENYYADINGIGTFCHEFSHVLGLPDLYDTDYSGSGGESLNPGDWSIMAGGSGSNFGRNPVGYSLYERYALGFTKPILINEGGSFEMQPLDESNIGYRLNTPIENEFFLIENRQAGKWDRYLPGHGMLVVRVDSTDERVWWMNEVNCNPNHMYYHLLRASYTGEDSQYDPFPGNAGVTRIANFTNPSLLTWDGTFNEYFIDNIAEQDKLITFNVMPDTSILTIVEDFEAMPVSNNLTEKNVPGVFSNWNFSKSSVKDYEDENGEINRGVAMKKPSSLTTSEPLKIIPYMANFTVYNPTNVEANFRLSYSVDNGETWIAMPEGLLVAEPKKRTSTSLVLPYDKPIMLRFNQTSGSDKASCYLDNVKLFYSDTWPDVIVGDVNGDGEVNIGDINAIIDVILTGNVNKDINADVNGDGEVNIGDISALIEIILSSI